MPRTLVRVFEPHLAAQLQQLSRNGVQEDRLAAAHATNNADKLPFRHANVQIAKLERAVRVPHQTARSDRHDGIAFLAGVRWRVERVQVHVGQLSNQIESNFQSSQF